LEDTFRFHDNMGLEALRSCQCIKQIEAEQCGNRAAENIIKPHDAPSQPVANKGVKIRQADKSGACGNHNDIHHSNS